MASNPKYAYSDSFGLGPPGSEDRASEMLFVEFTSCLVRVPMDTSESEPNPGYYQQNSHSRPPFEQRILLNVHVPSS
jgi:hypothetical protein